MPDFPNELVEAAEALAERLYPVPDADFLGEPRLDRREIMCVDTNRAGTADTAPPRHQEASPDA